MTYSRHSLSIKVYKICKESTIRVLIETNGNKWYLEIHMDDIGYYDGMYGYIRCTDHVLVSTLPLDN